MKIAWSMCARAFGVSAMTIYRQRDRRRFTARNDSRKSEKQNLTIRRALIGSQSPFASGFDFTGWTVLTGSDAGNESSSPLSSLSCISLSAFWACFGLAACLSLGAGSNLSVIASPSSRYPNAHSSCQFQAVGTHFLPKLQGISERAAGWSKSTMAESSRQQQRQDKRSPDRVSFWFWWSAWCWQ